MKINKFDNDIKIVNLVSEIIKLPFYYIIYVYKNINIIYKYSFNKKVYENDFAIEISHTFIGILTLNFYVYLLYEFQVLRLDFMKMINEFYFFPFYIINFLILFVFSLIVFAFIVIYCRNINIEYLKSLLLLNIKLFNIFMPILFFILIFCSDILFYNILKGEIDIERIIYFFIILISIVLFILYLVLLLKRLKIIGIFIQSKLIISILLTFIIVPMTVFVYYQLLPYFNNYMSLNKLINTNEFCKEISDIKYFEIDCDSCEKSFDKYLDFNKECQKIIKIPEKELIKKILKE